MRSARDSNLRVELSREVLCHSEASRAGLELLLVQQAVHFAGLTAGGGGAGPARVHWENTDKRSDSRRGSSSGLC